MFNISHYNNVFHTFQNSYKGSIQLGHSVEKASLAFTPVINPISPKDIKQGMKVYNYDETKWFSLEVDELEALLRLLPSLNKGQLNGNFQLGSVSVNNNSIMIVHYPNEGTSILTFSRKTDENNTVHCYVNYTLKSQNKETIFNLGLDIGPLGFRLLERFIEMQFIYSTQYKAMQKVLYDLTKQNNNQQKNNNYQQRNNSYQQQNYQQKNNNYQQSSNYQQNSNNNYQQNYQQQNYHQQQTQLQAQPQRQLPFSQKQTKISVDDLF